MKALALCLGLGLALAACPKSNGQKKTIEPVNGSGDAGRQLLPGDAGTATVTLPPEPPLPEVPFGLPPVPTGALDGVTPEAVAMGSALFHDPRLASDGKTTCATCHDPADHFNGVTPRARKANDKMPPQLENLAWNVKAIEKLPAHVAEVMHPDLAKLAGPYQAHIARVGGTPDEAVKKALVAFVITRYDGNSPWDHEERTEPRSIRSDDAAAGYKIFNGKGRCATCHTPPLYTDLREHDLGFTNIAATRSLRGCARRGSFFLAESAITLQNVLDFYLEDHPKTELHKIALTGPEQAQLLTFLAALSGDVPTTILQPLP
ncbi:MAG TPA: cytochrome c peroxidase [Kofleriaceae bacterium]